MTTIDEIRDNFALLDDWDDRYRYVIELGRTLVPMSDAEHSAANKVQGCASQVWLDTRRSSDPRRIVMLPQGLRGQTSTLTSLRAQDLVICRDRIAYRHARRVGPARAMLAHDMAFHLDVDQFLNDQLNASSGRAFLEDRLVEHGWSLQRFDSRSIMTFTRLDSERVASTPDTDLDISHALIDEDVNQVSPISAWSLLECVRHSRRIVTDRLHVAIAASLLGVPTQLWPNSYDKNRSVFDHSLRRFPTVEFVQ